MYSIRTSLAETENDTAGFSGAGTWRAGAHVVSTISKQGRVRHKKRCRTPLKTVCNVSIEYLLSMSMGSPNTLKTRPNNDLPTGTRRVSPVSMISEPLPRPWVGVNATPRNTSAFQWAWTSIATRPSLPAFNRLLISGSLPIQLSVFRGSVFFTVERM